MSNTNQRHIQLIKAVAQKRDKEAYTELFDYYAPRINAYLLKTGCSTDFAEEIAQDVMITLWRKADRFDAAKANLSTWIFRVARNRRIDLLRRIHLQQVDNDIPEMEDETCENPDENLDLKKRQMCVQNVLKRIPKDQLDLIRMSFFSDLSHNQIAIETGLPLGTVKSRIRLAFAKLRKELEADQAVQDIIPSE